MWPAAAHATPVPRWGNSSDIPLIIRCYRRCFRHRCERQDTGYLSDSKGLSGLPRRPDALRGRKTGKHTVSKQARRECARNRPKTAEFGRSGEAAESRARRQLSEISKENQGKIPQPGIRQTEWWCCQSNGNSSPSRRSEPKPSRRHPMTDRHSASRRSVFLGRLGG